MSRYAIAHPVVQFLCNMRCVIYAVLLRKVALYCVVLRCVALCCVVLRCVVLCCVVSCLVVLCCVVLYCDWCVKVYLFCFDEYFFLFKCLTNLLQ